MVIFVLLTSVPLKTLEQRLNGGCGREDRDCLTRVRNHVHCRHNVHVTQASNPRFAVNHTDVMTCTPPLRSVQSPQTRPSDDGK